MINIVIQKIKEQRNGIIYYAAGLFGYTWLLISMFPTMQKADMEQLTRSMPEEFMKFFGGDSFMTYSKIEGFLSLEYLGFFFILIITFYVGSSAGSAVAGSIEKRTIDFDLSQPISRTRYALGSFIPGLILSAFLVLFNAFTIWVLCEAYHIDISNKGILAFMVTAIFFIWAIYGIAAFFTSIFKSKLSVVLTTVVLTLGFYLLTSLSNIIDKLKDYNHYSLFYLYNPQKLLLGTTITWNHIAILAAILIVGLVSSIVIFNKKNL